MELGCGAKSAAKWQKPNNDEGTTSDDLQHQLKALKKENEALKKENKVLEVKNKKYSQKRLESLLFNVDK